MNKRISFITDGKANKVKIYVDKKILQNSRKKIIAFFLIAW